MYINVKVLVKCEGNKLARDWTPHEFTNCCRVDIPPEFMANDRDKNTDKKLLDWLNAEYKCPCRKCGPRAETKIIEILS